MRCEKKGDRLLFGPFKSEKAACPLFLFKCFASLRLAIFLLLASALVFSIGTFVESAYGTEAAKLTVYRSPWLAFLLILLGLNVAAAAIDRLPWKKKHVGFVITHLGILVILIGALVTRAYGIEGQVAIEEGATESRIILNEPMLQLFSRERGPLGIYRLPLHAFPWKGKEGLRSAGEEEISGSPRLTLLTFYPKSSRQEEVEASEGGTPALLVALESSWMKVTHWLYLDDPARSEILLGPAVLRFSRDAIEPSPETSDAGFLEFRFEKALIKIPVTEETPQKFPLPGTPYEVTLLRVLRDAAVEGNQLVDESSEWKNPACELLLEGGGLREKQTVFANFPEFPALHGMKPSEAAIEIHYRRVPPIRRGPRDELRFIWREGAIPLYQIRKGDELAEGEVKVGEPRETGWMDFKFRVEAYHPEARIKTSFREEPVNSQAEEHLSSVELEIARGDETKSLWLGQGERTQVTLGSESYHAIYGLRTLPMGFRLELRDFRVEQDPGTESPASFESDVTLRDEFTGTVRELAIRMNQPLRYNGFKVFQSGYQKVEGKPEVSVFTVAKDPGIPIKYGGALILIGGILTMFYSRRFSNQKEDQKFTPRTSYGMSPALSLRGSVPDEAEAISDPGTGSALSKREIVSLPSVARNDVKHS